MVGSLFEGFFVFMSAESESSPFARLGGRAIFGSLAQAPQAELDRLMGIYRIYLKSIAETSIPEILRSRLDESDLVQEALLRGASQLSSFQGKTDAEFAAWLRQILQNVIIDAVRHHTAQRRDLGQEQALVDGSEPSETSLSAEIVRREELQRVAAALMELNPEQRQVIELRSQGRPFDEVGRAMGRSADAARMLWGRAIERLSAIVGKSDRRE